MPQIRDDFPHPDFIELLLQFPLSDKGLKPDQISEKDKRDIADLEFVTICAIDGTNSEVMVTYVSDDYWNVSDAIRAKACKWLRHHATNPKFIEALANFLGEDERLVRVSITLLREKHRWQMHLTQRRKDKQNERKIQKANLKL